MNPGTSLEKNEKSSELIAGGIRLTRPAPAARLSAGTIARVSSTPLIVAGAPRSYQTTSPVAPADLVTPFRIARSRSSACLLMSDRNVRIVPVNVTSEGMML